MDRGGVGDRMGISPFVQPVTRPARVRPPYANPIALALQLSHLSGKSMRYAVLVTGPAGAGKSTFCASFMTHLQASRRTGHLVNLDPAAAPDSFEYAPSIDIKDLISVKDVMSELGYGPNGGLVYCFECVSVPSARPIQRGPNIFLGPAGTSCRIWTGSRRKLVNTMMTTLLSIVRVRLDSCCPTFFFAMP